MLESEYEKSTQEDFTSFTDRFKASKQKEPLTPIKTTTITLTPNVINQIIIIYEEFIIPDSVSEINIPGHIQTRIKTLVAVGDFTVGIFDDAVDEVLRMVYLNCFKAFSRANEPSVDLTDVKIERKSAVKTELQVEIKSEVKPDVKETLSRTDSLKITEANKEGRSITVSLKGLAKKFSKNGYALPPLKLEYTNISFVTVMRSKPHYEELKLQSKVILNQCFYKRQCSVMKCSCFWKHTPHSKKN